MNLLGRMNTARVLAKEAGNAEAWCVYSDPGTFITELSHQGNTTHKRDASDRPLSVYTPVPTRHRSHRRGGMQTSSSSSIDDDLQTKPFGARS